jgi:hypothetical protein
MIEDRLLKMRRQWVWLNAVRLRCGLRSVAGLAEGQHGLVPKGFREAVGVIPLQLSTLPAEGAGVARRLK